jgi:hypothetical protein
MQLTKAQNLYGQVRVEKDMFTEKLIVDLVESDRDRLRARFQEEGVLQTCGFVQGHGRDICA